MFKSAVTWLLSRNIFLIFLPLLLFYVLIAIVFSPKEFEGDEYRYIIFAQNLLNGCYSPPHPDVNLWNGPGYPLVLVPFVFFKLPWLLCRLTNAFLLYFSLIITFRSLNVYIPKNQSIFFTMILGLYFPLYKSIPFILTECFSWFLISLICYWIIHTYRQDKVLWRHIFFVAFLIGYLAMTKIIFGYVIVVVLALSVVSLLLPSFRAAGGLAAKIMLISFILCLPWLIYTYTLTGKLFYWGNSGGKSLYIMSTPYLGELGDWKNEGTLKADPDHRDFMDKISPLTPIGRDEAFKAAAIENIINHPKKFAANVLANWGRMLFSMPFSDAPQSLRTYFTLIPNMFVVVFLFCAVVLHIMNFRYVPFELLVLFALVLVYLFGSSFLSAYSRMFYITMPFWVIYISYMFSKFVSVKTSLGDDL